MSRKQGPHAVGMRPAAIDSGHRHEMDEMKIRIVEVAA
jgi:hypothetical protein